VPEPLPVLSLQDVHMSYWRKRREIVVLAHVSLDLHPGETIGVYAGRRAGKTTLSLLAAGLERPSRGAVLLDGRDLAARRRWRRPALRRDVAWVSGIKPLGANRGTVLEGVALPMRSRGYSPSAARRRAQATLARLDLADYADERWEGLTDGERTLFTVVGVLMREPKALVTDDLTINLDVLRREKLMALLQEAAREHGIGVLSVSSEMTDMVHADRLATLSEGTLMLAGPPPAGRDSAVAFPLRRRRSA